MKKILKELVESKQIFIVAALFLWVKTIIVGLVDFKFSMENPIQLIILLLNPLTIIMLMMGFIFMRKPSRQPKYLFIFLIIASVILFANGVYYREFSDFITIPLLFMGTNAADLSTSIFALVQWSDFVYFIDIFIVAGLFLFSKKELYSREAYSFRRLKPFYKLILIIGIVNLGLANIERPQLLTRSFDRELLVKNIGIYNFHVYDAYLYASTTAHRVFASENDLETINDYIEEEEDTVDRDLFGVAEGRNVIMIAAESVQNFVINNTVNGEEITPFLNELIEDSIYFEEFYHQTAQGKSSDSEFLIDNSLYPLPRGAAFFTHAGNEYYAFPEILSNNGYFTSALHANNGTFWNRNIMYESLGYDRFYTIEDYEVNEDNSIGWGLKDIDFMEQSTEHLVEMQQPFYAKMITLTNHFPFELDEEDHYIDQYDSNSRTLNRYFPTVRYTDEAIRVLIDRLKEEGLYEDSMIVIYGDHYGISSNHNQAMSQYLGKEVTPYVETELQQVPLIIHIPGVEGETLSTVGGQIDLRPTLLYLLGVKEENQTIFGTNLFSTERNDIAILRDGSFITSEAIYTGDVCYSRETEEPVGEEQRVNLCDPYIEEVEQQLDYSDQIVYGDLLRFDKQIASKGEDEKDIEEEQNLLRINRDREPRMQ